MLTLSKSPYLGAYAPSAVEQGQSENLTWSATVKFTNKGGKNNQPMQSKLTWLDGWFYFNGIKLKMLNVIKWKNNSDKENICKSEKGYA